MVEATEERPTRSAPGVHARFASPRAAVLREVWPRGELRSRDAVVAEIETFGVEDHLRGGAVHDSWAQPADVQVTDDALLIRPHGAPAITVAVTDVVTVLHSAGEPCSLIRSRDGDQVAVLVSRAEATAFRRALDRAVAGE